MNLAISIKGSDEITNFIFDCVQDGNNYFGSNIKLFGVKDTHFDFFWTDDIAEYDNEKEQWITKICDLSPVLKFKGVNVSTTEDVDRVTVSDIRELYSVNYEFKIHRLKDEKPELYKEYSDNVKRIVLEGKLFKEEYLDV